MSKYDPSQFIAENVQRHQTQTAPARRVESLALSRRDSIEQAQKRLDQAGVSEQVKDRLLSQKAQEDFPAYTANIENYIGTVSLPLGLAGPLSIQGSYARGEYYIPLATTEAALVASYNRGLKVLNEAGSCFSMVINNAVQRSPCFEFDNLMQAAQFCVWVNEHFPTLKAEAEHTTRFGQLRDIEQQMESNLVILTFHYLTHQAAGQNMVTLATKAAYDYILQHCPIKPRFSLVEANASGDKKMNLLSLARVRGYKVTTEICIPNALFESNLGVSVGSFLKNYQISQEAGVTNININPHFHFANALAALFIACGQDVACVAEAAVGITKFKAFDATHIYAAVTMPNIIVGTVGGGTQLPSQKACLELLRLKSPDNTSAELAEIIAGVCLAGEISLGAAISSGNFARAHKVLARSRRRGMGLAI